MGVGGAARSHKNCTSVDQAQELLLVLNSSQSNHLVIGEGSNILVCDEGFPGMAISLGIMRKEITKEYDQYRMIIGAGESLEQVVQESLNEGISGLELFSGIPGSMGAAPVQNVGAFGVEISDVLDYVECLDTYTGQIVRLSKEQCGFGYRTSIFNTSHKGRFWILYLALSLSARRQVEIKHQELAKLLKRDLVDDGALIREAVLALRTQKGMLVGPDSYKSVGSFFKNPIIDIDHYQRLRTQFAEIVAYPHQNRFKISAAWLIGQAGFPKGYRDGQVGISDKHNLCLINLGGATFKELMNFAKRIKQVVFAKFQIELMIEPEIIEHGQ